MGGRATTKNQRKWNGMISVFVRFSRYHLSLSIALFFIPIRAHYLDRFIIFEALLWPDHKLCSEFIKHSMVDATFSSPSLFFSLSFCRSTWAKWNCSLAGVASSAKQRHQPFSIYIFSTPFKFSFYAIVWFSSSCHLLEYDCHAFKTAVDFKLSSSLTTNVYFVGGWQRTIFFVSSFIVRVESRTFKHPERERGKRASLIDIRR